MPTIHQREILKELARGGVIIAEYTNSPPSNAHCSYRLSLSNRLVPNKTVQHLLSSRLIRSNHDGLFGTEGPPQSYSLWRASQGGA